MLKRSREEGRLLKPCTVATPQMRRNGGSKSLCKTEISWSFCFLEKWADSEWCVFNKKAESRGEGKGDFRDICSSFSETLEPCVTLYTTGKCISIPSYICSCYDINREWKRQQEWQQLLLLGSLLAKTFVPRLSCPPWDHLTCMDVLVEEMVFLAFLKNTAFGTVDFSNFTKSLPGFTFFFFNGDRGALPSCERGKGKTLQYKILWLTKTWCCDQCWPHTHIKLIIMFSSQQVILQLAWLKAEV